MTSPTSLWLARLRALAPTERVALVDEMSEGEAKMVLLRLEAENERLREGRRCAWCRLRRQHENGEKGTG